MEHMANQNQVLVFHAIMIDVSSVNRLNLKNSNINTTLYDFSFSSLLNIEYVDPSMNELFGSILPRIGNLSKLIYLDFTSNLLPRESSLNLALFWNLQVLHLNENHLTDSMPEPISQLVSETYHCILFWPLNIFLKGLTIYQLQLHLLYITWISWRICSSSKTTFIVSFQLEYGSWNHFY